MALGRLIIPETAELLKARDYSSFRALADELHPADVAEVIESVEGEDILMAFLALSRERQPEVFQYLDPETQTRLLDEFRPDVLSRLLNELSDDVRTELLDELPGPVTRRLLETLEPAERKRALALLGYPAESAGRLMTPEFLHINADATAGDVLNKVRRYAHEVETVYVIYVIDDKNKLIGAVSLRDVVVAKEHEKVRDFMTGQVVHVATHDDREHALNVMREYDLLALPVVDSQERLVGIVTFDDISDVHEDEATEDILKMHGVVTVKDDYFSAGYFKRYFSRVIWLVALAAVASGSVLVQQVYNPVIAQLSLLAAYITLLMASGGNVGTQSAGILIRAVSSGDVDKRQLTRIFVGEVVVGFALSATLAALGTLLVFARGADPSILGGHEIWEVAAIVGVSMFAAVFTTNALGAAIPLIMKRIKVDPAVTAGPFITTAADILVVLIYFNVAQLILLG